MATVYSNEVAVGTYNRIRVKCDYSGTSATLTVQFRRTSSHTGSWADYQANLTFNSQTKAAAYSYSGTVQSSSDWNDPTKIVNLVTVSGYTISTSGGTYNWSFNNPGSSSVLGCSGTITIPSQITSPSKPTVYATADSKTSIAINYGTADFHDSTGTVSLYSDTTASFTPDASNLIDTKTTTGSTIFNHTGLTNGATYYYKAIATNSLYSSTSDEVSAVSDYDYPPKFYGSVNDLTEKADKFYGSVNSNTKKILKIYGSENGLTKRIF